MEWVLVTGGVHADIGKGCLSAALGRYLSVFQGTSVAYVKIDPNLDELAINNYPNTRFGEVVRDFSGTVYDGDVAQARFYIPTFEPHDHSNYSLARLLSDSDRSQISLVEALRSVLLKRTSPSDGTVRPSVKIIEVGGTAGNTSFNF